MTKNHSTIGYLGPQGSHSHQAALKLAEAGLTAEPAPWPSLARLMAAVAAKEAGYGLLPVENALEGAVVEVMETIGLGREALAVVAEITIPVVHCLIRAKEDLGKPVTTVISHPQALAQCRQTLVKRFGDTLHYELAPSTSDAVRRLKVENNSGWAAIGTQAAAELYGLAVEDSDVSDAPDNQTRFWLVSAAGSHPDLPNDWASSAVKTSVCLGLKDRPGVLADALVLLKDHGVNLTRIESRPSKKRFGDYMFYLDMDCDLTGDAHAETLKQLQRETVYIHIAGPYKLLRS